MQDTGSGSWSLSCPWQEAAVSTSSYLEEREALGCEERATWSCREVRKQMLIIRANYLHWKISKLFSNLMNKDASN